MRTTIESRYINGVGQPHWSGNEPCRKAPEAFHPEQADYRAAAVARWICKRCPVQEKCLKWALADHTLEGIHAGTTRQQRYEIRKKMREAAE